MKKILLLLPILFSLNCSASGLIDLFVDKDSIENKKAVQELIYQVTLDHVEADIELLENQLTSAANDAVRLSVLNDYISDYILTANANRTQIQINRVLIPGINGDAIRLIFNHVRGEDLAYAMLVCKEWKRFIDTHILNNPDLLQVFVGSDIGLDSNLRDDGWSSQLHQESLEKLNMLDINPKTPLMLVFKAAYMLQGQVQQPQQIKHVLPAICETHNVVSVVGRLSIGSVEEFNPFPCSAICKSNSHLRHLCSNCKRYDVKSVRERYGILEACLSNANKLLPPGQRFFLTSHEKQFGRAVAAGLGHPYVEALFQLPLRKLDRLKLEHHPKSVMTLAEWVLEKLNAAVISHNYMMGNDKLKPLIRMARQVNRLSSYDSSLGFMKLFSFCSDRIFSRTHQNLLDRLLQMEGFCNLQDIQKVLFLQSIEKTKPEQYSDEVLGKIIHRYYSLRSTLEDLIGNSFDINMPLFERDFIEAVNAIMDTEKGKGSRPSLRERIIEEPRNAVKGVGVDPEVQRSLNTVKDENMRHALREPIISLLRNEGFTFDINDILRCIKHNPELYDIEEIEKHVEFACLLVGYKGVHKNNMRLIDFLRIFHGPLSVLYKSLNACFDNPSNEGISLIKKLIIKQTTDGLNTTTGFLYTKIKGLTNDPERVEFLRHLVKAEKNRLVPQIFNYKSSNIQL